MTLVQRLMLSIPANVLPLLTCLPVIQYFLKYDIFCCFIKTELDIV